LARRMSAISLSSLDEQQNTNYSENTLRQKQPATSSQQSSSSGAQRLQGAYQPPDRKMPTTVGPRINGANHSTSKPTSKTEFQRARTYSSPYASDLTNGKGPPKNSAPKSMDPSRSISPRPVDVKPTRIPKAASRPPISLPTSATTSPQTNGYSHSAVVTPSPQSPELPYQTSADQRGAQLGGAIPYSSTSSTVELSSHANRTPGLLNESAPFPTEPTMSSGFSQQGHDEDPPRPSMESEERPYEHWYRGEVSRNGGVGELRVGKRQEMLDIANYGHLIESKKKAPNLTSRIPIAEDAPRQRKRAGSISGITDKERGSLYLDEEHANEVGRVLDEHPLTDLDGEGSDIHSTSSDYHGEAYAYMPGIGEATSADWTATAGAHEIRSTTPTPNNMFHRPSSRQQQNLPPTRIPGPSSRRSSESRSTTTTTPPHPGSMARGASEPIQALSTASKTPSPPPAPSSSSNTRQQYSSNTVPTSAQKRGASPATKKSKTAAKANRVKTLQGKKESNRGSVAYYPTPDGDEEDMADAIPSWTQPVHRQGNWDEVRKFFIVYAHSSLSVSRY
jgi:serine/arginine repetitive matrix protein 1